MVFRHSQEEEKKQFIQSLNNFYCHYYKYVTIHSFILIIEYKLIKNQKPETIDSKGLKNWGKKIRKFQIG